VRVRPPDREIHAANEFIAAIADMLEEMGLSKADLARLVDKNPSAVHKLFLAGANPTLSTAFGIAHALGAKVTISSPTLIDASIADKPLGTSGP
jgi:transcriptional regulator with XRE-family HTH domain